MWITQGILFKNLMVTFCKEVVCYDETVRNVSNNSIIWFEYGAETKIEWLFSVRKLLGVLIAIAMLHFTYKAISNSKPSSNSSWDLLKEILLSKVSFKNELIDHQVI